MAKDVTAGLTYYLCINKEFEGHLVNLRSWTNLKVATDQNQIWLTNFTRDQIEEPTVKKIPFKEVYYGKEGKLFLWDKKLPSKNEPNFLWTPITRAFPLKLKGFNHNYFGIDEQFEMNLVQDEKAKAPFMMRIGLDKLYEYVISAPNVRLKELSWVMINGNEALIFGDPILPINGAVFWKSNQTLIPVGYNFELSILANEIEKKISPENNHWILWNKEGTYTKIEKSTLKQMSIASVKNSVTTPNG